MNVMMHKNLQTQNTIKAQDAFFPAACVAAIVLTALAQAERLGLIPWAQRLTGIGHAHEMLFGFVLALICGYTLGKLTVNKIIMMLALWLSARVSYLLLSNGIISEVLNMSFTAWVIWHILPRFMAAKKWRNRMIGPLLLAIFSFPTSWFISIHFMDVASTQTLIPALLILLIMLMAFIAGRMLAPALAGEMHQQHYELKARVQPRIEAALLLIPALAFPLSIHPKTQILAACAMSLMTAFLLIRLFRWEFWRCAHRSDLMTLVAGYFWLVLSTLFLSHAFAYGAVDFAFLHVITIGAIGTLSSVVILKYSLDKHSHPSIIHYSSAAFILFATLCRLMAAKSQTPHLWLNLSLAFWSLNYCMVLFIWQQGFQRSRSKKHPNQQLK